MSRPSARPGVRSGVRPGARPGMRLASPRIVVAGVIGAAALGAGVALTATSGWLIVRASEGPVILSLLTAIVAVRTFGMARPVLRYWERLRSHDAALDDLARARTAVYAALVPLTPARLPRRGRAAVLSGVVDDVTDRVEAQVRVTVPLLAVGLTGAGAAVLCALVEPWAGALVAALLVVVLAVTVLAWRVESRSQAELGVARGELTRVSELVASQSDELQAIGATDAALRWVGTAHAAVAESSRRQAVGRAVASAALPLATALATVGCAVVAGRSAHPPPVAALLVLAPFALSEVFGPLPDVARAWARAQASAARLDALLDATPAVVDDVDGSLPTSPTEPTESTEPVERAEAAAAVTGRRGTPHLRLSGVSASWDGERTHLTTTDLDLPPGTVQAVVGPSGCGKSTLLAVLARQLDPSAGSYLVDGTEVRQLPAATVRGLVAVVDDEPHVFATSVRENLRLARPDADDLAVVAALRDAGLGDWLDRLPDGLDTVLGSGGRGVSGGERARLSIARALLSGRPVLLLDEPVAHLDHPTAVAVLRDLVRSRAGRTVVVVSHRPEGLADADGIMDLTNPAVGLVGQVG
ncbi:thiol reductant ABC exporter subunit CydC [Pedococcus sp. KACC 23699]|uniref:Thiol reductant ABC exporter subunit CydC n=1 Tax=Pedococcus sp. KACC 23699 TaxID=3149228 RepID=A0AAU7JYM8_9MICO